MAELGGPRDVVQWLVEFEAEGDALDSGGPRDAFQRAVELVAKRDLFLRALLRNVGQHTQQSVVVVIKCSAKRAKQPQSFAVAVSNAQRSRYPRETCFWHIAKKSRQQQSTVIVVINVQCVATSVHQPIQSSKMLRQ